MEAMRASSQFKDSDRNNVQLFESIREDAELTGENEKINIRSSDRDSNDGEFDPGSERTLAARFKHASRAAAAMRERRTGE